MCVCAWVCFCGALWPILLWCIRCSVCVLLKSCLSHVNVSGCECIYPQTSVCLSVSRSHKSPTSFAHPTQSLLFPESVARSAPSVRKDLTHSKLFCALIIPILSFCIPSAYASPTGLLLVPRLTVSFIRVSNMSSISVLHVTAALRPWPPAESQHRSPKKCPQLYLCLF